jgi:hypothetical protein
MTTRDAPHKVRWRVADAKRGMRFANHKSSRMICDHKSRTRICDSQTVFNAGCQQRQWGPGLTATHYQFCGQWSRAKVCRQTVRTFNTQLSRVRIQLNAHHTHMRVRMKHCACRMTPHKEAGVHVHDDSRPSPNGKRRNHLKTTRQKHTAITTSHRPTLTSRHACIAG